MDESDGTSGAHNWVVELHSGGFVYRRRRPALSRPPDLCLSVVDARQVVAVAQYPRATELKRRRLRKVEREDPVKRVLVSDMGLVEERVLVPARQR
jgi:hypothetical protein